MKLFTCNNCGNPVYFENHICFTCYYQVGFEPNILAIITLKEETGGQLFALHDYNQQYRFCSNAQYGVCNWLIPHHHTDIFCMACSLNRTIPTLTDSGSMDKWRTIENAKHRLIYSLMRLHLPLQPKAGSLSEGVAFDFMEDVSPDKKIMTGHLGGAITINIAEADEAARVRNKQDLGEKYRTLLGHFRHEIGHYYWDILIKDSSLLYKFRDLFGNETNSYEDSLKQYYEKGASPNWSENFISPYAASHPWEDWAETWAHYLHMMDTLETAYAFGVGIHPEEIPNKELMKTEIKDPYQIRNFANIIAMWLPLTFAVNSLNRSMGHPDFYPFIISDKVVEKLSFIHEVCMNTL